MQGAYLKNLNTLESSAGDTAWWNQHHVPGQQARYIICMMYCSETVNIFMRRREILMLIVWR